MKKELTALCIALAALNGCSNGDQHEERGVVGELGTTTSALFGETGGLPWGSASGIQIKDSGASTSFGREIAVGDFDGDGISDIATSDGALVVQGRVYVSLGKEPDKLYSAVLDSNSSDDGYDLGASLTTISCPSISSNDLILASAPTYSMDSSNYLTGAFALLGMNGSVLEVKGILKGTVERELAGMEISVGDVDGDGKPDLVYQSTPLDAEMEYLPQKVNVVLDICSKFSGDTVTPDASVTASDVTDFGAVLYIKNLSGTKRPEIVVVDPLYVEGEGSVSSNGAIYFYEFSSGKLQSTRSPIVGERNSNSGASIQSIGFSDIDNDGDLDLIVGEPMLNVSKKREGRVRTYTNKGAKTDFDVSDMQWSASGGRSHGKFGSKVIAADVNGDNVDDLIVGAPGFNGESEDGSAGIFVFVGTKDGSIFSEKPFWSYISYKSVNGHDSFGLNFAAADFDHKGWLDLAVSSPNYVKDISNQDDTGRFEIFYESSSFCYNANSCFIDNACIEANAASSDSKCQICDPRKNNFGYSELTCTGSETACQYAASCDAQKGCVANNKEDGASCAQSICSSNNLTVSTCQSGVCQASSESCGNYVCDTKLSTCPTTCKKDSECTNGTVCVDGVCSTALPVLEMPSDVNIVQGKSKTLTASVTYSDIDNLTYEWDCGNLTNIKPSKASVLVTVDPETKTGSYKCTLTVTDPENRVVTGSVKVKVIGVTVSISTPEESSTMTAPTVLFGGESSGTGVINVINKATEELLCTGKIKSKAWSCSADLKAGDYTVYAVWGSNTAQKSGDRSFKVASSVPDNNSPIIIIEDVFMGRIGDTISLDASKTYDPDNDALSFKWTGDDAEYLSSTTVSDPKFTIPETAVPGETYSFVLTVTDDKKASVSKTVIVSVADIEHTIQIIKPSEDETLISSKGSTFLISGTTDIAEGEIIVSDDNKGVLCKGVITNSKWECQAQAEESEYSIVASWTNDETNVISDKVSFRVELNEPPIINVSKTFFGTPGEKIVLDACGSYDPDGDTLTYSWYVNGGKLDNNALCGPMFEIPEDVGAGFEYQYTLTVSDGILSSSTTGKINVSLDYDISISIPSNNAIKSSPVRFEGMANADCYIEVRDSQTNDIICLAVSDSKNTWRCDVSLDPGQYSVQAYIVLDDNDLAASNKVSFTVRDIDTRPVIVSPKSGEKIAVRPTISGTVESTSGDVSVWINYGSYSVLMCSSEVSSSGTWSCTTSFDLDYSTTYTFEANWKSVDSVSNMSDPVTVTTVGKSDEPEPEKTDVVLTSPTDGSELDASIPVIFAGTADPGSLIDVYVNDDMLVCTTIADESGNWACSDVKSFTAGTYTAYADDSSDSKIIPSNSVTFTLVDSPEEELPDYSNARGGSCSISTQPSGHLGWIFLLAGFAGLGAVRRRRSE